MRTKTSQVSVVAAVLLGGLLVCSPVTSRAASISDPAGGKTAVGKERFRKLAAELQLTEQQKLQLKPIFREEGQKLKGVRAETGLTKKQKHEQVKQIHQDFVARIKAVLTPEQFEKWQTLRAEHRGHHHGKRQATATGL